MRRKWLLNAYLLDTRGGIPHTYANAMRNDEDCKAKRTR